MEGVVKKPASSWSIITQTLGKIIQGHGHLEKESIAPSASVYFYAACQNLLKRINAKKIGMDAEGEITSQLTVQMNNLLKLLDDKENPVQIHSVTLLKWYELTATALKMCKNNTSKVLFGAYSQLLTRTIQDYDTMSRRARKAIPNPRLLAEALGLLTWDIPNVEQAFERARSYYQRIQETLSSKGLGLPESARKAYEKTVLAAIKSLGDVPSGDIDPSGPHHRLFTGALFVTRQDSHCVEVALNLYETLTKSKDAPWLAWDTWMQNECADHRSRATTESSPGDMVYNSSTWGGNIRLCPLKGLRNTSVSKVHFTIAKPKGTSLTEGFLELAGVKGLEGPSIEKKLFEMVICKGRTLLEELHNGPFRLYLGHQSRDLLFHLQKNVLATMARMYRENKAVIAPLEEEFISAPALKVTDTAETLFGYFVNSFLYLANCGRSSANLKKQEVVEFFKQKDRDVEILKMIELAVGKTPYLNLYAQLVQQVAEQCAPNWLYELGRVNSQIRLHETNKGRDGLVLGLENFFFHYTFFEFCVSNRLAFPEELILHVGEIDDEDRFLFHRDGKTQAIQRVIEAAKTFGEEDVQAIVTRLEKSLQQIENSIYTAQAANQVVTALSDLEGIFKPLPQGVSFLPLVQEALELCRDGRSSEDSGLAFRAVSKCLDDPDLTPTDIRNRFRDNLQKFLPVFEEIVQAKATPLCMLNDKSEMEKTIVDLIFNIRKYRGIPELPGFQQYAEAVYLLLCLVQRHDETCPDVPDVARISQLIVMRSKIQKAYESLTEQKALEKFEKTIKKDTQKMSWWKDVKKDYLSHDNSAEGWGSVPMARGWDSEPVNKGWMEDPNISFLVMLRNNADRIMQCSKEWFYNSFGNYVYLVHQGKDKEEQARVQFYRLLGQEPLIQTVPATYPSSLGPMIRSLAEICKRAKEPAEQLRKLEKKIRGSKEYVLTAEEKKIFDLLSEFAAGSTVEDKINTYPHGSGKDHPYHADEIRIIMRILKNEPRLKEQIGLYVEGVLWKAWITLFRQ